MVHDHCECLVRDELVKAVADFGPDKEAVSEEIYGLMVNAIRTAQCPVHHHGREEGVFQTTDLYLITGHEIGHILNCLSAEAMGHKNSTFCEGKARLLIGTILQHAKLPTGAIFTRVELPVRLEEAS